MNLSTSLPLLLGALALAGCTERSAPKSEATPTTAPAAAEKKSDAIDPALMTEAQEIFSSRCMPCHGPMGRGDGPASAGLTPKPRNFHDTAWQAAVSDQHIETIIQYGGAAVGKSPAMPPNPDLNDKPVVKALRAHIRSLAKP